VTVLAHGVGGRQDLPIPFTYALIGAALALVVSFVALAVLWRERSSAGPRTGVAVPPPYSGSSTRPRPGGCSVSWGSPPRRTSRRRRSPDRTS
jgi:hypothetical protein